MTPTVARAQPAGSPVITLGSDGKACAPVPGQSLDLRGEPGSCVAVSVADPSALAATYLSLSASGVVPLVLNPLLPEGPARSLAEAAGASAWVRGAPEGSLHMEQLASPTLTMPEKGHVLCTSGTTGAGAIPSMFFFARESAEANARAHLGSLGLTGGGSVERMLLPMPLSHSFGLVAGLHAAAELDATLFAFASAPDPSTLLTVLERERIELLYLTPPLLRMLLKRARGRALGALPHLRIVSVGSAAISRAELRDMLRCFPGAHCFHTYGLTELGPRVSTFAAGRDAQPHPALASDPERPAPVGEPLDGVALELRELSSDGVGELFVTTPYAARGRLREGKVEPLAVELGFATRDAARRAPDGQLELLGRRDGTIVRGGTNVYPANVERVASQVSGVRGSCLVPRPSPLYGQVPVLVIDLEEGAELEQVKSELAQRFRDVLVPTDVPVDVQVVANLPRTALGKVQRAQVVELVNQGAQ